MISIKHNWVLVEIAGKFYGKARGLYISSFYHPEAHVNITGLVRAVPEKLLFFKKEIDEIKNEFGGTQNCPIDRVEEIRELTMRSVQFDVSMELKENDFIYFHYNVHAAAERDGLILREGKNLLILIPYDMIFLAIRNEKIIPVNGWVLIEPIKEEGSLMLIERRPSQTKGVISHMGSPVRNYLAYPDETDDDFFKTGDTVLFRKNRSIPVEWSIHKSLDKKYQKLQRKDLLGKFVP